MMFQLNIYRYGFVCCVYYCVYDLRCVTQVKIQLPSSDDKEHNQVTYTRTGLVGFFQVHDDMVCCSSHLVMGALINCYQDNIFIHGSLVNFIEINGRRINTDDVISTVSLVKPLGILHKAR